MLRGLAVHVDQAVSGGKIGGRGEDRTLGLCIANAALSQLSYAPHSVVECVPHRDGGTHAS